MKEFETIFMEKIKILEFYPSERNGIDEKNVYFSGIIEEVNTHIRRNVYFHFDSVGKHVVACDYENRVACSFTDKTSIQTLKKEVVYDVDINKFAGVNNQCYASLMAIE